MSVRRIVKLRYIGFFVCFYRITGGGLFCHAETGHFEIGKALISPFSGRRGILPRFLLNPVGGASPDKSGLISERRIYGFASYFALSF